MSRLLKMKLGFFLWTCLSAINSYILCGKHLTLFVTIPASNYLSLRKKNGSYGY